MIRWEYLIESVPMENAKDLTVRLNGLGAEGWEVVFGLPDSTDPRWAFVFLKRASPD